MAAIEGWLRELTHDATLGPKAGQVAELVAAQPRLAAYASAAEVARRAGVNVATVVRAAQSLGFTGWPGLQLELRSRYLASLTAAELLDEHDASDPDPIVRALRSDMDTLALTLRTLDLDTVRAVSAAITGARRTLLIASGSFAAPALQLAHIGAAMGLDIELEDRGGTHLVNRLTRCGPGDCLIAVNFWKLPRQILHATRLAHQAGLTTCVITDLSSSALARAATHVISVPSEGTSHFPSLTAATSVMHAILADMALRRAGRAHAAIQRTEQLWRQMDLIYEQ
jgi:DNA-binding MurR/RpiR family transcriptional regulator